MIKQLIHIAMLDILLFLGELYNTRLCVFLIFWESTAKNGLVVAMRFVWLYKLLQNGQKRITLCQQQKISAFAENYQNVWLRRKGPVIRNTHAKYDSFIS